MWNGQVTAIAPAVLSMPIDATYKKVTVSGTSVTAVTVVIKHESGMTIADLADVQLENFARMRETSSMHARACRSSKNEKEQWMNEPFDPAVVKALQRALGHALPVQDDEWDGITDLHIKHARSLAGIERCQNLTMLILRGCDPVHLNQVAGLTQLRSLIVQDSRLESLEGLSKPPRLQFDVSQNLLTDLTPLLQMTGPENLDTAGNPLTAESYEQVIPALRERGMRVTCSAPEEWQLTLRMQAAGLPYCCYRDMDQLRLNSPGLGHTDMPEAGHPVVTEEELEDLLASDPAGIHKLFARRDEMWPMQ